MSATCKPGELASEWRLTYEAGPSSAAASNWYIPDATPLIHLNGSSAAAAASSPQSCASPLIDLKLERSQIVAPSSELRAEIEIEKRLACTGKLTFRQKSSRTFSHSI